MVSDTCSFREYEPATYKELINTLEHIEKRYKDIKKGLRPGEYTIAHYLNNAYMEDEICPFCRVDLQFETVTIYSDHKHIIGALLDDLIIRINKIKGVFDRMDVRTTDWPFYNYFFRKLERKFFSKTTEPTFIEFMKTHRKNRKPVYKLICTWNLLKPIILRAVSESQKIQLEYIDEWGYNGNEFIESLELVGDDLVSSIRTKGEEKEALNILLEIIREIRTKSKENLLLGGDLK